MNEYDIGAAFEAIEQDLIASMIRNMDRHRAEELKEGYDWTMWQAEQLKALERYKLENPKKYGKQFKSINAQMGELIWQARDRGNMEQEIEILKAIKNGFTNYKPVSEAMQAEFFRLNTRKLEALTKAIKSDMRKAETAILRRANDQYRKAIFNAQVYANSGAGTYEKAVDMATKDMLSRGLDCIEYKNGARHTLPDYADMAIRTASKRAYLQGEGEKRQEWGISTVIVNKRGNPCPKCLPFVGKVLIDDVWSGGKKSDSGYPLMSTAIERGLYHPRCKDGHATYFSGISTADDTWTKEELQAIEKANKQEAKQSYAARQVEKYQRLEKYSLAPENEKYYKQKAEEWGEKKFSVSDDIKEHRSDTPEKMVNLIEKYTDDEFVMLDETAELAFAYHPDSDTVVINPKHQFYPYYNHKEIMIHELGHRIDQNEFGSPMNRRFTEAILETEKQILNDVDKYKELFAPGGKLEYNDLISDIFGCITDNVVVGSSYHESQYIGIPGYTELEVFANLFAIIYQGDDATVHFIKSEMAGLYEAFLSVMEV